MESENYRQLLNNDRDSLEMTAEEFDNTLMHFAKLYNAEQCNIDSVRQRLIEGLEDVQFNHHAEGCGLEDRNITDRYEAMEHGWERCFEAVEEAIENVA